MVSAWTNTNHLVLGQVMVDEKSSEITAIPKLLEEGIINTIRFKNPVDEYDETDFGHGRIEQRKCSVYSDLTLIDNASKWRNLKTIIKVESLRIIKATGKKRSVKGKRLDAGWNNDYLLKILTN